MIGSNAETERRFGIGWASPATRAQGVFKPEGDNKVIDRGTFFLGDVIEFGADLDSVGKQVKCE